MAIDPHVKSFTNFVMDKSDLLGLENFTVVGAQRHYLARKVTKVIDGLAIIILEQFSTKSIDGIKISY